MSPHSARALKTLDKWIRGSETLRHPQKPNSSAQKGLPLVPLTRWVGGCLASAPTLTTAFCLPESTGLSFPGGHVGQGAGVGRSTLTLASACPPRARRFRSTAWGLWRLGLSTMSPCCLNVRWQGPPRSGKVGGSS